MTGHKSDLAAQRQARGMSVVELAARTGLNPRTIERIESGERVPHPATRRVIALTLDVPESDLFAREAA